MERFKNIIMNGFLWIFEIHLLDSPYQHHETPSRHVQTPFLTNSIPLDRLVPTQALRPLPGSYKDARIRAMPHIYFAKTQQVTKAEKTQLIR